MKHISQLTNIACLDVAREEKTESTMLDPMCAYLVDLVFIKFALLCREYDALYADKRRENAEKLQWTLAFAKQNLKTKPQIQYALDRIDAHKWGKPPQLGQFLEWCKPSPQDLGFPSLEESYLASITMNRQFSEYRHKDDRVDTVIRHAIYQIGSSNYREMTAENSRKIFKIYYEIALQQFIAGDLQPIPKALTTQPESHPEDKQRTDAARLKAIDTMRKMGINFKTFDNVY